MGVLPYGHVVNELYSLLIVFCVGCLVFLVCSENCQQGRRQTTPGARSQRRGGHSRAKRVCVALVGGVLNYGIVSRELIHLVFFGSKIPSQVRHKKIDSLHTYCPTRCPFCGSEMQENDMFCWSLKCDMSPAFTPDGMWGEDSNELKSDTQMSSLLALDEQVIFPTPGLWQ